MQFARPKRESLTRGVICAVQLLAALVFLLALFARQPHESWIANASVAPDGAIIARLTRSARLQSLSTLGVPTLTFPGEPIRVVANRATLPVWLDTGGQPLGAVAFSLNLDPSCLSPNLADANADGMPDALANLPPGFVASLQFDAADPDSELDLALYDVSMPIESLVDGLLLTLQFEVPSTCRHDSDPEMITSISFSRSPAVVFGTTGGTRIVGDGVDAEVTLLFRNAPTDIVLSTAGVDENLPPGTLVGSLTTVDQDAIETHTYRLISAPEGDDNGYFTVSGSRLLTAARFNFEARAVYQVSLQATDSDGLSVRKLATVTVTDVNEPPNAADDWIDPTTEIFVGAGGPVEVLANDTDPDRNTRLAIVSVDPPDAGNASTDGAVVVYDPPNDSSGTVAFPYRITDNGLPPLTDEALIALTYVADDARGDCNADRQIDAADLAAVVLELYDEPVNAPWYQVYADGFAGSPQGCDANGDRLVQAGDLACAALLAFGRSCMNTESANEQTDMARITLHVADALGGIAVDVGLIDPFSGTTALVFSLAYDPTQVDLDPADLNGDGVSDAISWSLPSQAQAWAFTDPGIVQAAVVMAVTPPVALPAGNLLRIQFERLGDEEPGYRFLQVSAGSTTGSSTSIQVPTEVLSPSNRQLLPLVGQSP